MKKGSWLVVGIIGIVIVALLFGGGMMMGGWGYHGWNMMGPGGMMGNWGYSPSPLNWIGMVFMWLIPIGLVLLAMLGILWLVRRFGNPKPPSS